MLRNSLLATTMIAMLAFGSAEAAEPAPSVPGDARGGWFDNLDTILSDTTAPRFLVNECVIATGTAVAVSMMLASPAAPALAIGLGAAPEMPMLTLAGLSCASGMAAGLASATVAYTWVERDRIGEAATTQVAYLMESTAAAGSAVVAGVSQAVTDPFGTAQTAAATVVASVSGMLEQGRDTAGALVAGAAATVTAFWAPPAPEIPSIDVASVPVRVDDEGTWVY